jgi:hypothetical protein
MRGTYLVSRWHRECTPLSKPHTSSTSTAASSAPYHFIATNLERIGLFAFALYRLIPLVNTTSDRPRTWNYRCTTHPLHISSFWPLLQRPSMRTPLSSLSTPTTIAIQRSTFNASGSIIHECLRRTYLAALFPFPPRRLTTSLPLRCSHLSLDDRCSLSVRKHPRKLIDHVHNRRPSVLPVLFSACISIGRAVHVSVVRFF